MSRGVVRLSIAARPVFFCLSAVWHGSRALSSTVPSCENLMDGLGQARFLPQGAMDNS